VLTCHAQLSQHSVSNMPERARQLAEQRKSQIARWKAVATYLEAEEEGNDVSEAVAIETMGVASLEELTSTQKAYLSAIVRKVRNDAEKIKEQEGPSKQSLEHAKQLFERGQFWLCIEWIDSALEGIRSESYTAGECEAWKAMAFERLAERENARAIYERLKDTHPRKAIRKYADQLLRIMQAPKLALREDEKVKVPTSRLEGLEKYKDGLGRKRRAKQMQQRSKNDIEPTLLEKAIAKSKVPEPLQDGAFVAAASTLLIAVAIMSAFFK